MDTMEEEGVTTGMIRADKKSFSHHVRNSSGASLVDIIAALPAGLLVVLIAAAGIWTATQLGLFTRKNADAQAEVIQLSSHLRRLAQFAVNVRYFNGPLENHGSTAGEGYARSWSFTRFSDAPTGAPVVLMYFNVEDAPSRLTSVGTLVSSLRPVAVFFRPPTAMTSGAVLIDHGDSGAAGVQTLSAGNADLVFENVVGVETSQEVRGPAAVLERLSFQVTMRSFVTTDHRRARWCPQDDIAATAECGEMASFRDTSRLITLRFDNNKRSAMSRSLEFPAGVYLMRPVGTGMRGF